MSTTSRTTKSLTPREVADTRESAVYAADGTRLFVRHRAGPGSVTVLMCDGIICDGFIYKYLWDDVATVASVAHFHYRGHGRSGLPADPARIGVTDLAADMNSVRSHLGDPPVVLMGHSVGTQVVLEAYRQRPSAVQGLVLLCGSSGRVTHTFKGTDRLAQLLPRVIELAVEHRTAFRALWARLPVKLAVQIAVVTGEVNGRVLHTADLEPYFEHLAHVDPTLFLRMLERAGEHSAEDMLGQVAVPTLVVAGDRDSFTPAELSRRMAEQIPDAELLLIPGATHVAPLEHREEVFDAVAGLVERAAANLLARNGGRAKSASLDRP